MSKTSLEHNIEVHNKIAKKYEIIHGEIYNEIEQSRLHESLRNVCSSVETGNKELTALDFGCGAGNLTQHLTDLGCTVVACDISKGFLDLVSSRVYKKPVITKLINGVDLSGIESDSVDIVAMYSVLHHVPDYLLLMKEFMRVLKKGGVLYIDHEASDFVWNHNDKYSQFLKDVKKTSKLDLSKYFMVTNYIDRLIRMFINPKYQREGDIHVFKDDHIEWGDIRNEVIKSGGEIINENDYLLFKRAYNENTFNAWKDKVNDIHCFIARKQ